MVGGVEIPHCNCQCPSGDPSTPQSLGLMLTGLCLFLACVQGCLAVWRMTNINAMSVARDFLCSLGRPLSSTQRKIREIADQKLLEQWLVISDVGNVLMAPALLLAVVIAVYFQVLGDGLGYFAMYAAVACVCFSILPFHWHRRNQQLLDLVVAWCFLVCCFPPGLSTCLTSYYFTSQWIRALHLLAAQVCRWRFYLPLNVIHLAWQLWTISTSSGLQDSLRQNLFIAIMTTSFNLLGNAAASSVQWTMAKALFQASHNEAVVRAFLAAMCDAFVQLGADLKMLEDSPRLAAILQNQVEGTASRGTHFACNLTCDDIERFETFVSVNVSSTNVAQQILLNLRDSTGDKVPVKVYHMCLGGDEEGQVKHYLGIVLERSPEMPLSPRLMTPQQDQDIPDSALALHIEDNGVAQWHAEAPGPDGYSTALPAPHVGPFQVESGDPWGGSGDYALLRVRTKLLWEIIDESSACSAHFGFKESTLDDFLSRCTKPHSLLRWLEASHCFAAMMQEENPNNTFNNVRIVSELDGIHYDANVHLKILSYPSVPPEEEPEVDLDKIGYQISQSYVEMELKFHPVAPEQPEEMKVLGGSSRAEEAARRASL